MILPLRPQAILASLAIAAFFVLATAYGNGAYAQVQVAVIGDSNVYGKGVSSSENYPTKLEAALRARGLDVRVSNGGVNGDTSAGLAARLDSAVPAGTRVAVIWVGINDVLRHGKSRAEVQANVAGIVSRLRAKGIESYFIRPPVYNVEDHKNPALTISGDNHFNGAGYSRMVAKTIGPIQALVVKARKQKGS
ncbi:GDSL-type esterase/lipase family protein [Bradyrhizobium sp. AZCC 1620]|uniref:GDSL-type esterase/lipase family protein n=1 Tax=Bradyrhizobium sp. AZCC 1620 TaxID=3117023 RepID=UPI002FEEC592